MINNTKEITSSYDSLAHSKYDCKYHVVFIPKCRRKVLFKQVRSFLGPVFRELARQKECQILEGKTMPDHVHMLIKIPPKHAVSSIIGYLKGKSAIAVARQFHGKKKNFEGEQLWARGYAVSTVGFEVDVIRAYIKHQEDLDARSEEGAF